MTSLWHTHTLTAAPSGIVASLSVTATSTTSVTIEWGRVPCRDRNADITHYSVTHIPFYGGDEVDILSSDVSSTNELPITGLIPRTAYTVQVRADHIRFSVSSFLFGTISATVIATTLMPDGKVPV